jgi:hypothetical protein
MAPGSRRLPEDSVVTSLSEIQSILQTSELERRKPAGKPIQGAPAEATAQTPSTVGAPVPSAAEIRATREARWQEEMADAQRAPAPAARRVGPLTWMLVAVGLLGGGVSGWWLWPAPLPAAAPIAEAPLVIVPPVAPTAAPVAAAPVTAAAPIAPVEVAAAEPAPQKNAGERVSSRRAPSQAARQRASAIDAAFGPRPTQSRGKLVAKPKIKRKRTRADSQLDSVLDGL